jgi:hypothetical protein
VVVTVLFTFYSCRNWSTKCNLPGFSQLIRVETRIWSWDTDVELCTSKACAITCWLKFYRAHDLGNKVLVVLLVDLRLSSHFPHWASSPHMAVMFLWRVVFLQIPILQILLDGSYNYLRKSSSLKKVGVRSQSRRCLTLSFSSAPFPSLLAESVSHYRESLLILPTGLWKVCLATVVVLA